MIVNKLRSYDQIRTSQKAYNKVDKINVTSMCTDDRF